MGSFYTFREARLLSVIQHWIGKKPGVESACFTNIQVVLRILMSKWHESSHGLVRMCLQTSPFGVLSHPVY